MPQIAKAIFGAIAVALTFGAVQLASGRDLATQQDVAGTPGTAVNRAAKGDRAARMAGLAGRPQTRSLRRDSRRAPAARCRVPLAREARNGSSARWLTKSGDGGTTV